MRIAIVSDIHANLAALNAVLAHAGDVGSVWCLGDTVGYGPQPNECIAVLRERELVAVAGNHDLAAIGRMATDEFNEAAASAAHWTSEQLSDEARSFLDGLPKVTETGDFTLAHGSIRWPEWEYLLSAEQAQAQFELQKTPYSIVGHTHVPALWEEHTAGPALGQIEDGTRVELASTKLIINPGGVGQPRDGDPRAAYALYDDGDATITYCRVEYDIAETQTRMEAAGLPEWLIERLSHGR
jgi:predicted phosphodiesterase